MLKTAAKLELAILREDHVQREHTKVNSNTLSYRRPLSPLEKLCASKVPSNSYLRDTDILTSRDRTEEASYPHIKANNVATKHTPRTTYYTWERSGLQLGCTLHGGVVNGHTVLTWS